MVLLLETVEMCDQFLAWRAQCKIKNGGRIKGEGKTSKTSKNTSQRQELLPRLFGRELPRLGGVTSCLPACLVSVVRPPFDLYM